MLFDLHLEFWQNLDLLGLAFILFLVYGTTSHAFNYRKWGLRVIHYTALALVGVLIFFDGVMALGDGRFLAFLMSMAMVLMLTGEVTQKSKELRKAYRRIQERKRSEQSQKSWIDGLFDRIDQFWTRYQESRRNRDLYKATIREEARLRAERKLTEEDAQKEKLAQGRREIIEIMTAPPPPKEGPE